MKMNVANQFVGAMMTYAASGTPITTSGAVTVYVRASSLAMQIGAVGAGICIPNSYGFHHYVAAASETNFEWVAFTFVASGGISVTNQLYTEFPQTGDSFISVGSVQTGVNSIYARVGAPVGASLAADVTSIAAQVGSNFTAISSLHTRVSSVQTGVDSTYGRIGVGGAGLTTLASSGDLSTVNLAVGSVQIGVNSLYARVGTPIGASLTVDVSSIQVGVGSIYSQTNKLQFGGSNRLLSDMAAVNSDATAAANMAKTTRALGRGTVTGSGPPTVGNFYTSAFVPSGAVASQFRGRLVTFDADTLTAALRGQATNILSNTAEAAPLFGVSSLTTAPVSGDTFSVS
jgi:hypothetical protein